MTTTKKSTPCKYRFGCKMESKLYHGDPVTDACRELGPFPSGIIKGANSLDFKPPTEPAGRLFLNRNRDELRRMFDEDIELGNGSMEYVRVCNTEKFGKPSSPLITKLKKTKEDPGEVPIIPCIIWGDATSHPRFNGPGKWWDIKIVDQVLDLEYGEYQPTHEYGHLQYVYATEWRLYGAYSEDGLVTNGQLPVIMQGTIERDWHKPNYGAFLGLPATFTRQVGIDADYKVEYHAGWHGSRVLAVGGKGKWINLGLWEHDPNFHYAQWVPWLGKW